MLKQKKGFTLIELLVVIAIIAILAGLILVRIGSASDEAKDAARKSDLNQVKTAIEQFRINGGKCAGETADLDEANTLVFTSVDSENNKPNNYLSGDRYPEDPDGVQYSVTSDANCIVTLTAPGEITVEN